MLPPLNALLRLHELRRGADPESDYSLTEEHTRLIERLSPKTRQRYERALRRFGDTAVVSAERGICKGCFVLQPAIPEQLDDDITQCQSCGRLLYDPDTAYDLTAL